MHEQFLLAALEQAKQGQGSCAPNPCVGAVAVQDGKIIAQAWHKGAGTPHAEQLLLAELLPNLPNITLYITLEPCNHWGRTPPCVDQIIKYGIREVVFAYLDPNPLVSKNKSCQILRQQGIQVTHFPLKIIDDFYKSYTHWIVKNQPRITVKMAQTLDGKIAGPKGMRKQLTNDLCSQFTHQARAKADVILTTARTVMQDNPRLTVRLEDKEVTKPIAILDSQCRLHSAYTVFKTGASCLIYHLQGGAFKVKGLTSFYPMPEKNGKIDLLAVIDQLGSLGFHDVWVEAGAELFTSLHLEGLVHRTYLYLAPQILGPQALCAYSNQDLFKRPHRLSWQTMGDNIMACLDWQEN